MKYIWQCMFSPRLYKVYRDGTRDSFYQPKGLEKWGDKVIVSASTIWNIGFYASPFICIYMYRRGMFSLSESIPMIQFIGSIGCLLAISLLMRGIGRAMDTRYVSFLQVYNSPATNTKVYLENIRKYDFDFSAWPVTYNMGKDRSPYFFKYKNPFASCANDNLPAYQRLVIQLLAFVATHTFGLKLIYPGSVGLVHTLLWTPLLQGRTLLVENYRGLRTKLGTVDGNEIDTMFVDNRNNSLKGSTLVICCEGNSGFYEIGIMTTPITCGYSAIGWNHPGFAGSTGEPYPDQEQKGIDAVMQYAINELGFSPENIVLFGWSIGGYTAAWAAVNYPIKALILDATFDDLLPLAQNQMPKSWKLLVKEVVRSHVDLHVAELVTQFRGPVQIVRRTEDEIICLRPGAIATNCGNFLLLKLLQARHPEVLTSSTFSKQPLANYLALLNTQRESLLKSKSNEYDHTLLVLINKYMKDYKSTHCTQLPADYFQNIMDSLN